MNVFKGALSTSFSLLLISLHTPVCADQLFVEGAPPGATELVSSNQAQTPLPSFAKLVHELSPAVVNIAVESSGDSDASGQTPDAQPGVPNIPGLPPTHPFFKREPSAPFRSVGSGFILSEDGYIATNAHVIEKSTKIVVRLLSDKREFQAKVVGADAKSDLALLKIEPPEHLKTVYIGDSDKLEVGDWVIAIGNQFQLGQTVTAGIVSATSRRVPTNSPYDAFIQTDASINPGSSGGPLFNIKGQVVGINTAIFSPGRSALGGSGFNIGIGFAIPINVAKNVLNQLRDKGKVVRGLLGVMIQKIDGDMAEALGQKLPGGALVAEVMPGTPAARAGFQRKDIIVSYNGIAIDDHDELPLLVANTAVDAKVPVEVLRGGKKIELTAEINELKDDGSKKGGSAKPAPQPDKLGLVLSDPPSEVLKLLGENVKGALVVESVEAGSPAERAGLLKGDLLQEINGQAVTSLDVYAQLVQTLKKDKVALLLVRKAEGTRYLTLRVLE